MSTPFSNNNPPKRVGNLSSADFTRPPWNDNSRRQETLGNGYPVAGRPYTILRHTSTPTIRDVTVRSSIASDRCPPKAQSPLSVYELPTATYMWPPFNPASQAPPAKDPIIYVKYRPNDPQNHRSNSSSRLSIPSSSEPSPALGSMPLSYSRKRSSSIDTDVSAASPSDRFIKHSRGSQDQSHHGRDSSHNATTLALPNRCHLVKPVAKDLHTTLRGLNISSDYSDEDPHISSPQRVAPPLGTKQTLPLLGRGHPSVSRATVANVVADVAGSEEWKKYAEQSRVPGSHSQYSCSWGIKDSFGRTSACGYTSKRHLVKRHIESKHLQLRPCICDICGKGFAQKSNLETHRNTHTGEAPHKCPYPGCNEHFKDPARRHRHMKVSHQHISSRTKKNRKQPDSGSSPDYSEPEEEEPITPS
ncbi:Zinc finger protein SNAI2 [Grifola frondosa]|uniref:Zinc finger protein SNAI2 n=1 Tax=Grifola frondosa TaxID=5627 RepID=A0A1C7M1T4_GRIFR|nr:Zinc finger protein SNAI2 [Grifola frondosa]